MMEKTIREELELIAEEICEGYCKYRAALSDGASDEEYEAHIREHCDRCPVMRL